MPERMSDLDDLRLLSNPQQRAELSALAATLPPEFILEQRTRLDRLVEGRSATLTLPNQKRGE